MSHRAVLIRATLLPALALAMVLAGLSTAPARAATTYDTVTVGATSRPLSGTDIARETDALVLYTPAGGTTTPTNVYGAEAVVVGGTVTALRDRQTTSAAATPVPANGYVLSGHGTARDWLLARATVGATVSLGTSTTPPPPPPPATGSTVTIGTASLALLGTNVPRGLNQLVAYQRPVTVTPTNQWGSEVTVVDGRVTAVNAREATQSLTGTSVPAAGYVLSGHGTAKDWLTAHARVGVTVTLGTPTTPPPTTPPPTTPPPTTPPPTTPVSGNTVTVGTAALALSGTNIARAADALVLYTPAGGTTTPTNVYGAEAVVVGGTVTALRDRQTTSAAATPVPANGYVLSGHGTARDWLLARATVGATVTLSTSATPPPPPPPPPGTSTVVKVMPMGDSITQVGGNAMGFKGYLLDRLVAAGERVDYVGSQLATGPSGLKDRDHEGHSGWQNSSFQPTAGGYVSTYKPAVIVYHVGTNDIWSNIDANTAIVRLRDVLNKVYAAKPDTHVVLAKIVRMNVGKDAQLVQYNNAIPAVVSDFKAQGRRISLADLSATLAPGDLQADGVHVTDAGHQKMAAAFYPVVKAAIESVR